MGKIIKQKDNRRIFIDTLIKLAEKDDKIILIVPDVGFNYIETFKNKFPDRYYNFGVTEQATMLIASGLALSGFKPYVYTMLNFIAFRPFEMVRNGIALHNANVKLIGVKGSEKYKFLGFSHNMIFKDEDIYHLKPYMKCYKPKLEQVENIINKTYKIEKPIYIRL